MCLAIDVLLFFFFKQKTAYEMRISDWSSDVCSSDLLQGTRDRARHSLPLCRSQRGTPGLRSARACCQNAMMMTGAPIKLTQVDAADVADLYNRCSDYFLLQDGAAPTLDDARELDRKSTRLNSSH